MASTNPYHYVLTLDDLSIYGFYMFMKSNDKDTIWGYLREPVDPYCPTWRVYLRHFFLDPRSSADDKLKLIEVYHHLINRVTAQDFCVAFRLARPRVRTRMVDVLIALKRLLKGDLNRATERLRDCEESNKLPASQEVPGVDATFLETMMDDYNYVDSLWMWFDEFCDRMAHYSMEK